jgi:hypothetical protein
VGGITVAAFLEALSPRFAEAPQVAKTDPRIKAESVEFPSPKKGCDAERARESYGQGPPIRRNHRQ